MVCSFSCRSLDTRAYSAARIGHSIRCVEPLNIFNGRFGDAATRVAHADDRFDRLTVLSFRARGEEAGIHAMEGFPVNVSLPAPRRTRNALRVEDERHVTLGAWQQAHHAIPANSFQRPGG